MAGWPLIFLSRDKKQPHDLPRPVAALGRQSKVLPGHHPSWSFGKTESRFYYKPAAWSHRFQKHHQTKKAAPRGAEFVSPVDIRDNGMKHIFCLSTPCPKATKTPGNTYVATETHSLDSVSARIGAPRSTVYRWIQSGDLPATAVRGGYEFSSNHLEEFALRIRLARAQKMRAAQERSELSAVVSNPAAATDEALVGAYLKSSGQTASHLWGEVSRRYQANPYVVNGIIGQAIRQNQEAAKTAPAFSNVWNKATGRTERVRVR